MGRTVVVILFFCSVATGQAMRGRVVLPDGGPPPGRDRNLESEGLDIYDPKILRSLDLPPLVLRPAGAYPE